MIPLRILLLFVIVLIILTTITSTQFVDDDEDEDDYRTEQNEEISTTELNLSEQFDHCPIGQELNALTRSCQLVITTTTADVLECPFAPEIITVRQQHNQYEQITRNSYDISSSNADHRRSHHQQPPITTCSNGYTWNGLQCIQIITTDAQCADNYSLIDGTCQTIRSGYCPSEYSLQANGQCVYQSDTSVNCPDEHIWDGTACVHTIPSCPIGYSLGSAGMCQRQTSGSCPENRHLVNGRCRTIATIDIQCPPDFERHGTECVHRSDGLCASGFRIDNGKCVAERTEAPQYSCPNETLLVHTLDVGRRCIAYADLCPTGYAYAANEQRCLLESSSSLCPTGFTLQNNQCIRYKCPPPPVITVNVVSPICPADYELRNSTCHKLSIWPAIPPPLTEPSTTENITVLPIVPIRCGPNYVAFNETNCVRDESATPYCSAGFVYSSDSGECVRSTDENASTNSSRLECGHGFVELNGICVSVDETNPDKNATTNNNPCLPGYTFHLNNGSCLIITTNEVDEPNLNNGNVTTPICLPGYHSVNGHCQWRCDEFSTNCEKEEEITIHPTCPFGYTLIANGKCEKIQPQCPDNYIFVGHVCYPKHVVETTSTPANTTPPPPPPLPTETLTEHANNLTSTTSTTTFRCSSNSSSGTTNESCQIINTIHNNNTIYQPTNVVTTNENNVIVNLWRNGRLHSITRNNETVFMNGGGNDTVIKEEEPTTKIATSKTELEVGVEEDVDEVERCCNVVSPRQCKRNETTAEWHCYHRRYHRCGSFCTQATVQLAPRQSLYREPILMMPPPPMRYSRLFAYRLQYLGRNIGECVKPDFHLMTRGGHFLVILLSFIS